MSAKDGLLTNNIRLALRAGSLHLIQDRKELLMSFKYGIAMHSSGKGYLERGSQPDSDKADKQH